MAHSEKRISDFQSYYHEDLAYTKLLCCIKNSYSTFSNYEKPQGLTCLDPVWREADIMAGLVLNYEVIDIPNALLENLEFYSKNGSWGQIEEIKYLLPRLLEFIAVQILEDCAAGESPGLWDNGLTKYKLSAINHWPVEEKNVVLIFFYTLFEFLVNNNDFLIEVIEDTFSYLPLDGNEMIKIWDCSSNSIKKLQFYNFMHEAFNKTTQQFNAIYIGGIDITSWIISDKHIVEFDFCSDGNLFEMLLSDSKKRNSIK